MFGRFEAVIVVGVVMVCISDCFYVAGDPLLSRWSSGCVVVIILSIVLNVYLGGRVGSARRKFQFDYPNMYAVPGMKIRAPGVHDWPGSAQGEPLSEDLMVTIDEASAFQFNCVQRAHQNYLENLPGFLAMVILGMFSYPLLTTVFGLVWLLARLVYAIGYTSGPKGRFKGSFQYISFFGLLGMLIAFAVNLGKETQNAY
eukprot:TRINITY_DN3124_c0_g1_i1.p1 TRINITY_DN3124_c0_g1~~TRINITY_DN3124_c0_g1_i1.p1  ORF type:complete len:200 (-),score=44.54 TRINITY_DN3124_c0_g1_i1:60-659(-)